MNLMQVINEDQNQAKEIAQEYCNVLKINWNDGIKYIFEACIKYPYLATTSNGNTRSEVIHKWVDKYIKGKEQRISQRMSKLPGTVADPIVSEIIKSRLTSLNTEQLEKIKFAHRLSMSAENILGLLLEEYLAQNLKEFKWFFAWGETLRSVDFCSENIELLQIKNRSNSENSSSSKVREQTTITKWFRVDAVSGTYKWHELNNIIKISQTTFNNLFNEQAFINFVKKTLNDNPQALAIEENNPWGNEK